jgi:GntR family transcriptional regulator
MVNHRSSEALTVGCVSAAPPFEPDPESLVYLYVQVADHIAALIASGHLPPGAKLPNERDLAAEYRVSIPTARRAVAELRDRELVRTVLSKGTFVTRSE